MEAEFARASVLIVPLWVGAGARVKIIEAMAARLPVVSTSLATEGLGVASGTHVLEADRPDGLAAAAASLLKDASRGNGLAELAWQHTRASFSLDAAAEIANRLCASVMTPRASEHREPTDAHDVPTREVLDG
jgi:glycosyltransferase involved in cell wall biosynthesis